MTNELIERWNNWSRWASQEKYHLLFRDIEETITALQEMQQRIAELENEIKLLLHVTKGDKEENKRLDAALAEIRALCAQEGNDGEPWDTINRLARAGE